MTTEAKDKPRRPHGTGSIYPLPGGGFQVQIEAGWNAKGTRRYIRRYIRTPGRLGRQEAKAVLKELQRKGAVVAEGVAALTVKAWCDNWLEIAVTKQRPKTYATNRSAVRRWIVPTIGKKRLDKLTPADVRAVARAMLDAGLAPSSAQRAHVLLVKILRDAIVEGYDVPSRLLEMEAPERGESGREDIPLPDALAILAVAATRPDASLWVAAMLQGMRPAECRGLTWACVDLDADELDISWQLQSLPYLVPGDRTSGFQVPDGYVARQLAGAYHLVRPKTAKGRRVIPIVAWMHDALERWKLAAPKNDHDLVWPGKFGRPMYDKHHREAWATLCAAAEVGEYDLYSCRHTTVTLLTEAGVQPEVIRAIVGHASAASTRAYTHVQLASAKKALGGLAETLKLTPAKDSQSLSPGHDLRAAEAEGAGDLLDMGDSLDAAGGEDAAKGALGDS